MESGHRKPAHRSYRKHRRQVAWQVILPVVLAALVLIGVVYLLIIGTFRANGDVTRLAAISTMWLTLPFLVGGVVLLALVIALVYVVGLVAGFIPRYTYPAQRVAAQVAEGAHKVEHLGHHPMQIFPQLGRLARAAFHRIRRG